MKILLIHSDDDPDNGPWSTGNWDRIVDIGLGAECTYTRWQARFDCPISPLGFLRDQADELRRVRELLILGSGRLIDEHGLDWWEICGVLLHVELETLNLLGHFVKTIGARDEVHVSRPGLHANLLRTLIAERVHVFPLRPGARKNGLSHYARVSQKLSASQMIDVFWDKYDAGYQLRGRFSRKPAAAAQPSVLLPSAYVNVSRTGIAYANTFPEENFLLVATRRSAWVLELPLNVASVWLSQYASLRDRDGETAVMEAEWTLLLNKLCQVPEYRTVEALGYMKAFPQWLRRGFEVRDAWLNVLQAEPIQGVLCADDGNPYTRIPLLLAQRLGLPNIACHHGALDGYNVFKQSFADVIWAKGRMEQDYLVRRCGVPEERVEIAAPALPQVWDAIDHPQHSNSPSHLLFLSEPTEAAGGRAEDFYRDMLPPLADIAVATGRTLIIKLHPAESERQRAAMIGRILSPGQRSVTRIVSGPLTEDLLANAWFGITILSTVAMECAVRGIPCFLCKWLETCPHAYVEQFIRFGVGVGLNSPSEISNIPGLMQNISVSSEVRKNCWRPAARDRLRRILDSSGKVCTTAAG